MAATLLNGERPPEGTLITTNQQTAGRGQRGNRWEAQPGQNLTFSFLAYPSFLNAASQFDLNMAIALGAYDSISRLLPHNIVKIKWPNDLFVDERKVGGMLIENTLKGYRLEASVIGIGLNVNQTSFGELTRASSLKNVAGAPNDFDLAKLLEGLCECLEQRYLQLRGGQLNREEYLQALLGYNNERMFRAAEHTFQGTITGVDKSGKLQVMTDGQTRSFDLKEITFV